MIRASTLAFWRARGNVPTTSANPPVFANGVASDAAKRGEDPVEAVESAKSFGHKTHYVFALAAVIHNGPKEKKIGFGYNFGDIITFEGIKFRFEPAPNNNVSLVPVE